MDKPLLLTAIDPLAAALGIAMVSIPFQLIFHFLWYGLLSLLKIRLKKSGFQRFWFYFLSCYAFNIIVIRHNIYGPIRLINQLRAFYVAIDDPGKFQPLEIIVYWTLIALIVTLLIRL